MVVVQRQCVDCKQIKPMWHNAKLCYNCADKRFYKIPKKMKERKETKEIKEPRFGASFKRRYVDKYGIAELPLTIPLLKKLGIVAEVGDELICEILMWEPNESQVLIKNASKNKKDPLNFCISPGSKV